MACSLSLVSRLFYNASRSTRMQSVTCRGSNKITAFASVLERTPAHLRVVRHLFASCHPLPRPDSDNNMPKSVPVTTTIFQAVSTMFFPESPRCAADKDNQIALSLAKAEHAALLRILTLIAPTLRTLTLVLELSTWHQLPFPPALPALVELSIHHRFAGGCLRGDAFDCLVPSPNSSLRRLVLTGFVRVSDPIGVIDSIKRFAPSLTHLSLPVESGNIKRMIYEIGLAMDKTRCSSGARKDGGMVFPETLEDFFIDASPISGLDGPPSRIMANGNRRIVCSSKPLSRRLENPVEIYLHWVARMNGENGYWRAPSEVKMEDVEERLDVAHLISGLQGLFYS